MLDIPKSSPITCCGVLSCMATTHRMPHTYTTDLLHAYTVSSQHSCCDTTWPSLAPLQPPVFTVCDPTPLHIYSNSPRPRPHPP